jgi:hypothetical protein
LNFLAPIRSAQCLAEKHHADMLKGTLNSVGRNRAPIDNSGSGTRFRKPTNPFRNIVPLTLNL